MLCACEVRELPCVRSREGPPPLIHLPNSHHCSFYNPQITVFGPIRFICSIMCALYFLAVLTFGFVLIHSPVCSSAHSRDSEDPLLLRPTDGQSPTGHASRRGRLWQDCSSERQTE